MTESPIPEGQLDALCVALHLQTKAAKAFLRIALAQTVLMDMKQRDYGSRNISDFGVPGVVVRMNDKLQRIRNLIKKESLPSNESLVDSFKDIGNYGNIGVMLLEGSWPNE